MTYKEYIAAMVGRFMIEPSSADLICVGQGIDPFEVVDPVRAKAAICKELPNVLPGLKSLSEGGLSYSVDMDNLRSWYANLCVETGLPNLIARSSISDASKKW